MGRITKKELSQGLQEQIDLVDLPISTRQPDVGLTTAHVDRVDAAISTRATQASVNTITTNMNAVSTNVGSNADAASATGSVHAKLKDLKTTVQSSGGIKLVQRGIYNLGTGNMESVHNITISSVNLSKSFINLQSTWNINQSQYTSGGTDVSGILTANNNIKLVISGRSLNSGFYGYLYWEVIEFN